MARTVLDYVPTPKQAVFHASAADEVLYGGAAGGGKSRAIVMEALIRALETPGARCYLFRRTYPELQDTLISEALRSIPPQLGRYHQTRRDFELVNGSVLRFRHCARDADRFRYQGAEMHHLFIDELTHFSLEVYDYLRTRLRAPKGLRIRPVVRCASNPGGAGHAWVKARFVDAGEAGATHTRSVWSDALQAAQERTLLYLPATCHDNPHLSADYVFELEQKPPRLREALLHGRWDAFEGQAFSEWRDEKEGYDTGCGSHVVRPFDVPREWPRWRSFDFGYARPFSVGWWAVSPDGAVYRYREWYGAAGPDQGLRMDPSAIARGIREQEAAFEQGLHVSGVADPSIFDGSRGESIAQRMQAEGVYFEKGENARLPGKMQLHARLALDGQGRSGLYVFSTCRAFLRTLPALACDPARPEDVDTAGEDHAYDETRYFLMARPYAPAAPKAAARRAIDPFS